MFVGVLCLSLFCYVLLCVHSMFAIILNGKRKLVALLLLSYYKCSVALPHGAVGWSAVCDCDISYSLTFYYRSYGENSCMMLKKYLYSLQ